MQSTKNTRHQFQSKLAINIPTLWQKRSNLRRNHNPKQKQLAIKPKQLKRNPKRKDNQTQYEISPTNQSKINGKHNRIKPNSRLCSSNQAETLGR